MLPRGSDAAVVACCIAAALFVTRWKVTGGLIALMPLLGLPILNTYLHGQALAGRLALMSSGVRYCVPLSIICWGTGQGRWAGPLLRTGIALTFIGHGFHAFSGPPLYVALIQNSCSRLLGFHLAVETIRAVLHVIGVFDITAGALLFLFGLRIALIYMAVWGLVTSLSRVTAHGMGQWPEVAFRAAHFLVPYGLMRGLR